MAGTTARKEWHIFHGTRIEGNRAMWRGEGGAERLEGHGTIGAAGSFGALVERALERRRGVIESGRTEAFRAFSGAPDGVEGVFIDVYGPGGVLMVYEGSTPRGFEVQGAAAEALGALSKVGVRAVYLKPFAKDRSRMGGELPAVATEATPAVGETLPEAIVVREHAWRLEVRLYDGLSTGLFLDQRENRAFVSKWVAARAAKGGGKVVPAVLNTFAYTCAFSVAAAMGGGSTTSVDVSARYLEWGKRSFGLNGLDAAAHRFARMDTFEFFAYARRKELRYDMIILDPPSFASGSKRKGIRPWSSVEDYGRLVREAAGVLKPRGVILTSTNTRELCRPGRLEREIQKGLGEGVRPQWVALPPTPADFAREAERFAARAFMV